jgi:hypothetical protein
VSFLPSPKLVINERAWRHRSGPRGLRRRHAEGAVLHGSRAALLLALSRLPSSRTL